VGLDSWFDSRGIPLLALPTGGRVPLRFSDPVAEHGATRQRAGIFDFSFMGAWDFVGPEACAALAGLQTRQLRALAEGRIAYTLLLDEKGCVDIDATAWRLGPDHFRLFTGRPSDAARIASVCEALGVRPVDRCGHDAVIAVQGPWSAAVLAAVLGPGPVRALPYFGFAAMRFDAEPVLCGRIGYSGELGYELVVDRALGPALWQSLCRAGQALGLGLAECGFEAADLLRIESGYILFTRELGSAATPRELGLERLVDLQHGPFIGQEALRRSLAAPPRRRLAGLEFTAAPRDPRAAFRRATVTSECRSPSLAATIGLAWVDADTQPGEAVRTEDGRHALVRRLPFLDAQRLRPRAAPQLNPTQPSPPETKPPQ